MLLYLLHIKGLWNKIIKNYLWKKRVGKSRRGRKRRKNEKGKQTRRTNRRLEQISQQETS
jgi:hypothetical protein